MYEIKETENLRVYISKLIWVLLLFSVTLLVGNLKFGSDYIWISDKLLSAVFFCFFITLVIEKIPNNFWVARKLELIYSEIYIAQEIPISLLRSNQIWIHNDLIYLLLVLTITLFAANLFHPVFSLIQRHLN